MDYIDTPLVACITDPTDDTTNFMVNNSSRCHFIWLFIIGSKERVEEDRGEPGGGGALKVAGGSQKHLWIEAKGTVSDGFWLLHWEFLSVSHICNHLQSLFP